MKVAFVPAALVMTAVTLSVRVSGRLEKAVTWIPLRARREALEWPKPSDGGD